MKKLLRIALTCLPLLGWAGESLAVATVELTSNVSTVAEGGYVTFTVTVTPSTYVDTVTLSYEGEQNPDQDSTAPYEFQHQFNTPMDGLTVTATVSYTNGDPDGGDTLDIDVVGLTIHGTTSPPRGWPTGYLAQSNPPGKAISQFTWHYAWNGGSNLYLDFDLDDDNRSAWSGVIVVDGTLTCSVFISGVNVVRQMNISVTPRNWPIPITCAQDNESSWGDVPEPGTSLGENRDRDSDFTSYIFVPRGTGNDFTSAVTVAQIAYGPCVGLWYLVGSTLSCQRETVINRYIKDGGPMPAGASENFFDHNDGTCFYNAADFVEAVGNHEYRGPSGAVRSIDGHQGRIEKWIQAPDPPHMPFDVKQMVEGLTASTKSALLSLVNSTVDSAEDAVFEYAGDEDYLQTVGPNWGGHEDYWKGGQHDRWDDYSTEWFTGCEDGPDYF